MRAAHLWLYLFAVILAALASGKAHADLVRIEQAALIVGESERTVSLPHILAPGDFDPDGSTVTYRLTIDMPTAPEGLQALYVSKVGLSARLLSDGQPIWACGPGDLSELRCLHQPHLIQLPERVLAAGGHVLEFEVYADQRQANGLAPVMVGPYDELYAKHYLWMRLLKVDLLRALGIFAGVTGLLSLAAALAASRERVFFVFAAAAMLEALAVFLMSAIDPPGDRAIASWLIFSVRYVGVLMKLLLLYVVFGRFRLRDPLVACVMMLLVLGPAAMAVTDSSLWVVLALYLFVGIGMAATVVRLARWTLEDPSMRNTS